MPKKKTLADLGKSALEIGKVHVLPDEATKQIVDALTPKTELEKIEAEMREISPTLHDLKHSDRPKYLQVYKRYMWLVGERDRLKQ